MHSFLQNLLFFFICDQNFLLFQKFHFHSIPTFLLILDFTLFYCQIANEYQSHKNKYVDVESRQPRVQNRAQHGPRQLHGNAQPRQEPIDLQLVSVAFLPQPDVEKDVDETPHEVVELLDGDRVFVGEVEEKHQIGVNHARAGNSDRVCQRVDQQIQDQACHDFGRKSGQQVFSLTDVLWGLAVV